MYRPVATSAEMHHRRMERGVEAILACLALWLPGSTVEISPRSSDDGAGTFRIVWGDVRLRATVTWSSVVKRKVASQKRVETRC
jgi:hypothetical protein